MALIPSGVSSPLQITSTAGIVNGLNVSSERVLDDILNNVREIAQNTSETAKNLSTFQKDLLKQFTQAFGSAFDKAFEKINRGMEETAEHQKKTEDHQRKSEESAKDTKNHQKRTEEWARYSHTAFKTLFEKMAEKDEVRAKEFVKELKGVHQQQQAINKILSEGTKGLDDLLKNTTAESKEMRRALVRADARFNDKNALKDFGVEFASRDRTLEYLMMRFGGITKKSYGEERELSRTQNRFRAVGLGDQYDALSKMKYEKDKEYMNLWAEGIGMMGGSPKASSPRPEMRNVSPEGEDTTEFYSGTTADENDIATATSLEGISQASGIGTLNQLKTIVKLIEDKKPSDIQVPQDQSKGLLNSLGGGLGSLLPKLTPLLGSLVTLITPALPAIAAILGVFAAGGIALKLLTDAEEKRVEEGVQEIMVERGLSYDEAKKIFLKEDREEIDARLEGPLAPAVSGRTRSTYSSAGPTTTTGRHHKGGVVGLPAGKISAPTDEVNTTLQRGEVVLPTDVAPLYKDMAMNTGKTAALLEGKISSLLETIKELLADGGKTVDEPIPGPTFLSKGIVDR